MVLRRYLTQALSGLVAVAAASVAFPSSGVAGSAPVNLIKNGNFSSVTLTSGGTGAIVSAEFGTTNNGFTPTEQVTGWTTAGYNYVFLPNTADSTGATGQYGTLKLWGPGDGSNNGFVTAQANIPGGGNFIGADGAFEVSPISTTVNGLTPGAAVAISFAWAGAQQEGTNYTSPTTEQWSVTLSNGTTSSTRSTPVINVVSEGFSGWIESTFYFIPTAASETLSFLATGTPSGQPPFALLANVSAITVPEPASIFMLVTGIVGIIGAVRLRRRSVTPTRVG